MTESQDDLDTLEAAVLRHARVGMSPNDERRGTLLAKLNAGMGGHHLAPQPDLASLSEIQSSPLPLAAGRVVSLTSMLLGVVVAGAVGFGAGYLYRTGSYADGRSSVEGVADAVPSTVMKQSTAAPHRIAVQRNESTIAVAAEKKPESQPVQTRSKAEHQKDRESAAEEKEKTTFYNELSYVRRAQSALQKGDGALALGLMESLDVVERKGALLAERSVTKVLALCLLDRVEEASHLAQRALQSSATEVYRRRLATSCVASAIPISPAPQEGEQSKDRPTASEE